MMSNGFTVFNSPTETEFSIKNTIAKFRNDIYCIGDNEDVAAVHLKESLPSFKLFMENYLSDQPTVFQH